MHRRASGIMCYPMVHTHITDHIPAIRSAIAEHGHVRLVDTGITSAAEFHTLVRTLVGDALMPYKGGTNDRKDVSGGLGVLNTGSEPPHLRLTEHNEMCYMDRWPRLFAIGCTGMGNPNGVPAVDTGVTTFTDNVAASKYVKEQHPALYDRIATHGCVNVRILPDQRTADKRTGTQHTTWQTSFLSDDRDAVHEMIVGAKMDAQWLDDGVGGLTLRMTVHRPGFLHVPDAAPGDDPVMWHNQWSNNTWFKDWAPYDKMPVTEWPMHNVWGDGAPVTAAELQAMEDATWQGGRLWIEPWRPGELMLVDNHRVGHGRLRQDPSVTRTMAVLLADPVSRRDPDLRSGVATANFDHDRVPYRCA